MTLETINAIAQLLGAFGVIASLIYLSRQINDASTRASQYVAVQDLLSGNCVLLSQLGTCRDTARVWRLGMAADPGLSADELAQFHALLLQLVYDWQRIYYQDREAQLDPWVLESHRVSVQDISSAPGFQKWFPLRSSWFSSAYRQHLERVMADPATYAPLAVTV